MNNAIANSRRLWGPALLGALLVASACGGRASEAEVRQAHGDLSPGADDGRSAGGRRLIEWRRVAGLGRVQRRNQRGRRWRTGRRRQRRRVAIGVGGGPPGNLGREGRSGGTDRRRRQHVG